MTIAKEDQDSCRDLKAVPVAYRCGRVWCDGAVTVSARPKASRRSFYAFRFLCLALFLCRFKRAEVSVPSLSPAIDEGGSLVTQRLVRSPAIIVREVIGQARPDFFRGRVPPQINVFVFHRAPEALHEDVVQCPPATVHRERRSRSEHAPGEFQARELTALIGVEDLRATIFEGPLQPFQTEGGVEGTGEFPGQNEPTVPVDDRKQVDKTPGHRVEWGRGVAAASPSQNRACPFPSTRLKPFKRLVRDAAIPHRFRLTGALSVGCDLPDILATLAHTR